MLKSMTVHQREYNILQLLGHGKGGYSYLVEREGQRYVLKQIHHEPCAYYSFGNKIEAEQNDYQRLVQTGIRMPKLLEIDIPKERILKEYIEGATICELIKRDAMKATYMEQVLKMAKAVQAFGLNIDYFPTNFVVRDDILFYIDYECNEYTEQWNFENWGIRYWSKTPDLLEYMKHH